MAASPGEAPDPVRHLEIDTQTGSLMHLCSRPLGCPPSAARTYVAALSLTFLPLLIAAALGPWPLAHRTQGLRLPLLLDWNVAFMLLVSFPVLVVLTLRDHDVLSTALRLGQADGVVVAAPEATREIAAVWNVRFRWVNRALTLIGIAVGSVVAIWNYRAYTPPGVGFWIAKDGELLLTGYVFLWSLLTFYTVLTVYVARSFAISLLLRDIVRKAQLRMMPFHPDRAGGLRPFGELGLRNQYALTVCGVNLVLLVLTSYRYLEVPRYLYQLILAAAVAYVVLGPVVFLAPLLPFRGGMLRTKTELLSEVAQRLRVELQRLRSQLRAGPITKEDEELIDRLRKVGAVIDELPVWPFDTGTVRKFLTAYVIPLASAVAYPIAKSALSAAVGWLRT